MILENKLLELLGGRWGGVGGSSGEAEGWSREGPGTEEVSKARTFLFGKGGSGKKGGQPHSKRKEYEHHTT